MANKEKQQVENPKYNKQQILTAQKYADRKDLINAILKDGELYTFEKVDELIKKFMERKTN